MIFKFNDGAGNILSICGIMFPNYMKYNIAILFVQVMLMVKPVRGSDMNFDAPFKTSIVNRDDCISKIGPCVFVVVAGMVDDNIATANSC
ncbi:MAG: hypothetical protein Kow00108_03800 [Calditrichia bacterium]